MAGRYALRLPDCACAYAVALTISKGGSHDRQSLGLASRRKRGPKPARSVAQNQPLGVPRAAITVVIVDDHLLVADSIAAALGATADIVVLDIADSCESGLAAVARHRPDVLLLDQRLPDGLGTSILPAMLAVSAQPRRCWSPLRKATRC